MRVYMDTCCYKRPFNDQSQERIRNETKAIMSIMDRCEKGKWQLLTSSVLKSEFEKDKDVERQQYMLSRHCNPDNMYFITAAVTQRAAEFQKHGVKLQDSLHLATAEVANADVLLTVDDQFINSAKRTDSRVKVVNPANLKAKKKGGYYGI